MALFDDLWTDTSDASDTSPIHSMWREESKDNKERIYRESREHVSNVSDASTMDPLLPRIKAVLANGPILYSEVLTRTGATEGEIREAIRNWYGLISGRIQGKGEEFYWWIDSESSRGDRP